MMAFDLVGLSVLECESIMKAMVFSGQLLHWPGQWLDTLASLQSIGSTGNKAKPIVASAMAAIGLKVRFCSNLKQYNVIISVYLSVCLFVGKIIQKLCG